MNEEQIKLLCKLAVEYGNRPLSHDEKELVNQAIDQSKDWEELFSIALASLLLEKK